MKKIIFISILLIYISYLNSQSGWFYLSNMGFDLESVYFINQNTGWIAGGINQQSLGGVCKTTDGGANWPVRSYITNSYLYSIYFADQYTGWAAGGVINGSGKIIKTTNSGVNWQTIFTSNYLFFYMYFKDANTGWAYDASGAMVHTTNGSLWVAETGLPLNCRIFFLDSNTGWAAGSNLYKSTNGGTNWYIISSPTNNISRVFFIDQNTGWVVIPSYTYKTTNGGTSWTSHPTTCSIYDVYFSNSNTGWAITHFPPIKIVQTTNGGANWVVQFSAQNIYYLSQLFFINQSTGWVVGVDVNLKTTNGGISGLAKLNNEKPEVYTLYQNYPNPFNPITKMKFDLAANVKSETSNVKLIIYDILGREVATLVNEKLQPGSYEVEWNGNSYPSGVYFYKLKAGDYSDTKKLILMK